jgi:KAP family P-loop domain
MYSDNETSEDLLGFEDQVEDLLAIVADTSMLPVTIGVLGDWGCGKSSLLKMAKVRLLRAGALVVEFSPWRIETYDDAKTAMLTAVVDSIAEQLPAGDQSPKGISHRARALEAIDKLRKRVRWMRVVGLAAKHVVTLTAPSLDDLDGLLCEDKDEPVATTESVSRDFRAEFEELVRAADFPVVVVLVDDLDRCMPEQVLDVLQAIRLFLAVEGTAFVLATDERVVRDAVRLRYPQAASASETDLPREYLEKIVQVPLRIPPLGAAETESYLNLLVAQRFLTDDQTSLCRAKAGQIRAQGALAVSMNLGLAREAAGALPAEAEREFELMGRIARLLAAGLKGNPRQVKRYLNAFEMRARTAERRHLMLDRAVLAKLMMLEYSEPLRLRDLNAWQVAADGRPEEIARLEEHVGVAKTHKNSAASEGGEGAKAGGKGVADKESARKIKTAAALDPTMKQWVDNSWLTGWLHLPPALNGVDLAPYLELARASLPALAARARALPADLQRLLEAMCSATADVREAAVTAAKRLEEAQIRGLMEAGLERLTGQEVKEPLALSLVDLALLIPPLVPDVLAGLRGMPYATMTASFPGMILKRLGALAVAEVQELLRSWAEQDVNKRLAIAARQSIQTVGG